MPKNVNSSEVKQLLAFLYFLLTFTTFNLIPDCNAQTEHYLRIPALGRISNLGFLYNERTDTFRDASVFRHAIPNDAIIETQSPTTTTDIPLRNTFDEISHLFESDLNTGLNILTGHTKPKGASSILTLSKQITGGLSVTMVDTHQTVVQQLQSFYDGLKPSYNTDLIHHRLATHIVTGVSWGARVAVTLQSPTVTGHNQDAEQITDEMNTELLKLKGGNIQTEAENSNFTILISADTALPSPVPTTLTEVQKFLFQIPEQLKGLNGGKGVPLEFRLTPIGVIREHLKVDKKFDNPVHKIPSSILRRFTSIYMDCIQYEKHINDLNNKLSSQLNCALPEAIRKIQDLISIFYESKSSLSDTLGETLIQVRSGTEPVSKLYDLAQQYRSGNFSFKFFQTTAAEFDVALKKSEFCNCIQNENRDIEIFGLNQNLISRISENTNKSIYILFTKTEFVQHNPVRYVENLNTFLKGPYDTTEGISQFIVDCDFDQPFCINLTDTAIHEYRNGMLTSTDFKHAVLEMETNVQMEINNLKNATAHLFLLYEEQNIMKDKCAGTGNTCLNGGSCQDTENSFVCNCPPGFQGTKCERMADHCENSPCQNNGACRSGAHSFTCTCPQGFKGKTCEVGVDECSSMSKACLNGGECIDEVDGYLCVCPLPWAGHTCQHKLDPCRENPCQNEANCSPSLDYLHYVCSCASGYNGTLCEFDFGLCTRNSSLCLNGGTCQSGNGTFTCECTPGFDGSDCAQDIDDCAGKDLCQNGGTCIDKTNNYSCICSAGFIGENCSDPDAFSKCSALARSSQPPITMVNIACNVGLIPIFSHGFPAYYEYNVRHFNYGSEDCVWTLDNNRIMDNKYVRTDIKLKISIECERFGDANDTLSVIQWQRNSLVNSIVLRKVGDSLISDKYYDSIHLSFSSSSVNQGTGFVFKVEYVKGGNRNSGRNYFYSSISSLRYFSSSSASNSMSIVININKPVRFTVNSFDSGTTSNVCSEDLYYDTFFVYEISNKGTVTQLLKLCGKQTSAVSVTSNFPLLVVMEAVREQIGKQIELSWSDN